MKKLTTEEFIKRSKAVHGMDYTYSNTSYQGWKSKLTITCVEHGDFEVVAYDHLRGVKCRKCSSIKRGIKLSELKSNKVGSETNNWKGEDAGYIAKHTWIARHYGKPSFCEHCKTTTAKRFDWANVTGKYKRDRSDWIRLCRSCHMKQDRFKTYCKHGHEFTPANTKIDARGHRRCKECASRMSKEQWLRNKYKQN